MSHNTEVLCTCFSRNVNKTSVSSSSTTFFATGNHLFGELLPPFGLLCGGEKNMVISYIFDFKDIYKCVI